jgi:hypothetical protein
MSLLNSYYLYVHRLLTANGVTNQPFDVFYVGQGSGTNSKIYKGLLSSSRAKRSECRAFEHGRGRRSAYWCRTAAKYGVIVEIVKTNLTQAEACAEEKALISYYGRNNLVNLTEGGEGGCGRVLTATQRHNLSQAKRASSGRATICLDTQKTFDSASSAADWLVTTGACKNRATGTALIGAVCLGHRFSCYGYKFAFADGTTPKKELVPNAGRMKKVVNMLTSETFSSIKEAAAAYGVGSTAIRNNIAGKSKTAAGTVWAYYE